MDASSQRKKTPEIKQFCTVSRLNVEDKTFFGILARRLTTFMLDNDYMDTSVQKGGVTGVPGCLEHTSVISKIIEDAKRRPDSIVARPNQCLRYDTPQASGNDT